MNRMRVCWITDDPKHPLRLAPELGDEYSLQSIEVSHEADRESVALVVYANAGPGSRSRRSGLRSLETLRREYGCRKRALVYSFEDRELLAIDFPLLRLEAPGVAFIRLPCSAGDFAERLGTLSAGGDLGDEEFRVALRWYSGLQNEWVPLTHNLEHLLRDLPTSRAEALRALTEVANMVTRYALDLEEDYNRLRWEIESCDAKRARDLFESLTDGLAGRRDQGLASAKGLTRTAIPAYDSILIADDGEYPPETVIDLRRLGYTICAAPRSLRAALDELQRQRPPVVFADYQLGTVEAGRAFMQAALSSSWKPIVVAISRASVAHRSLPDGALNLTGPDRFRDADQLHAAIVLERHRRQQVGEGA